MMPSELYLWPKRSESRNICCDRVTFCYNHVESLKITLYYRLAHIYYRLAHIYHRLARIYYCLARIYYRLSRILIAHARNRRNTFSFTYSLETYYPIKYC